MTIDLFKEMYPDASWLESKGGLERWSNGEEEGSEHESVWFDSDGNMTSAPD